MSVVHRTRAALTVEQIYAIAELEYSEDADISRARGAVHEVELEFTSSSSGGRHVYVKDHEGDGLYHIARNGNTTWCERS